MKLVSSRQILEENIMVIRPLGAELYHADRHKAEGQTDIHDEANSRFP